MAGKRLDCRYYLNEIIEIVNFEGNNKILNNKFCKCVNQTENRAK